MSDPIFTFSSATSFGLYDLGWFASPTFVDIDKDGDLDIFVGDYAGNILFLQNTGTANNPAFADFVTNPFGLTDVGDFAAATFADIDNDGDLDAFVGNHDGNTLFFKNTGTASNPIFAAATTNPFGLTYAGTYASPTFVDIDNDGDLDAFVGSYDYGIEFFRNTGTATNAVFSAPTTNRFGLNVSGVGIYAAPTFVDIDGDGDLDAFVGDNPGDMLFFRNSGTASNPVFDAAISNPFGLSNVGLYSKPTFVDIDGDGDLDAFVGNSDGYLWYFTNSDIVGITGTANADNLAGTNAKEFINGLAGNDTLNGGLGADTMIGGTGNDVYFVDNSGDVVTETSTLATEIDTVNSSISYTLNANVERLVLTGTALINGTGNELNNTLTGNSAANILIGGAGNDTLNGGAGIDSMNGGSGNDTYYVYDSDVVTETSTLATEIDTVNSAISYTLKANVENLTLIGTAVINGTGNELNNILIGNNATNTLTGGLGKDTYVIQNSTDIVVETSTLATEIDTVNSSVSYSLNANVENLTLTGTTAINGVGNQLNNTLIGNSAANSLSGGLGKDILNGGAGNDILDGGFNSDVLTGGAGQDIFRLANSYSVDTITDFSVIDDTIQLKNTIFASFQTTGTLAAGMFRAGAGISAAADANDYLIYNTTTGDLYYDDDANGTDASAVKIAILGTATHPALTAADFVVI